MSHLLSCPVSETPRDHRNENPPEMADHGNDKPPEMADHGNDKPPKMADHRNDKPPKMSDHRNDKPPKMSDHRNDKPPEMADHRNDKPPKMADHRNDKPPEMADHRNEKPPEMADHRNDKPPKMADHRNDKPPEMADHRNDKPPHMSDHRNDKPPEMADHRNDKPPKMADHRNDKPPKMADHRNDSSQMKQLLQPDVHVEKSHGEKQEHEREHNSKESSTSCFPFSSSSALSSAAAAVSRGPAEREESSCCLLDDLKRLPQGTNKLGRLNFSRRHTVLIDVQLFNSEAALKPQEGRDTWSGNFVKMPCSQGSHMTVKTGIMKQPTLVRRWEVITKKLSSLAKKTSVTAEDVEGAIIKYNPKYKGQWSFDGLSAFVKCVPKAENYFSTLFPKMAALALKLPDYVKKAVPLLQRGRLAAITLSQVQISCLLANAFFCTFPHRNTTTSNAEYHDYPIINFTSLFGNWSERKKEKLRAIMHYFNVVTDENAELKGLVTFERRCLKGTDVPNWRSCTETLPKLHTSSLGAIETEGTGMLQVDFASSWIGGGVLGSGLVQEEILFLMNPELIVARLFTEKLEDNECLIITGSQQFSCYSGFGDTFEWAGPHEDRLQRDEWARRQRQIVAIDALSFRHRKEQYDMRKVTRELNKAYCGFKGDGSNEPDIATGKWGCGAFNGDPQLKAVIQLMAAAKANRGLAFFTFQDEKLKRGLQQIHHLLLSEEATVGKLYRLLEDFCAAQCRSSGPHVDLFEFIRNAIRRSRSQL